MTNAEPWSAELIAQQHDLLASHRRTLQHYLGQQARLGLAYMPPGVAQGIDEARINIRRIKAALRSHGAPVTDHPDDETPGRGAGTAPASTSESRTISTGGGDYGEGGIDKRQGVFISGGTIYGPLVGTNTGTITSSYGSPEPASTPPLDLEQALREVQQAAQRAQQHNDSDLADDLGGVAQLLQAAITAEQAGKTARRATKLHDAQDALRRLANGQPDLDALATALGHIA